VTGDRATPTALDLGTDKAVAPLIVTRPLDHANDREDASDRHRVEIFAIRHAISRGQPRPAGQQFGGDGSEAFDDLVQEKEPSLLVGLSINRAIW